MRSMMNANGGEKRKGKKDVIQYSTSARRVWYKIGKRTV